MASQKYVLSISLQRLLNTFINRDHSFICYAGERIITADLPDNEYGYVDSNFFWAELHRLDPELFRSPIDLAQEPSAVIEQWINKECLDKFQFIKDHVAARGVGVAIRNFRKQLLALLVERHGPDTEIPFNFTKG